MTTKPSATPNAGWLRQELAPRQALASLNAALILYLLEMIITLSVAALVFSGPLAVHLPYAISFVLIGNALLVTTVTLLSSYGGSMAVTQDTPGVILAAAVATVGATLAGSAAAERLFPTTIVLLIGCTLMMGLICLLLGLFKLGALVRYLPFPVMGGFLAGTGWLLAVGGISVAANAGFDAALWQPERLARWLPALLLGALMLFVVRRSGRPTVLALMFGLGFVVFYAVMALLGKPPAALSAEGWLLGPFPSDIGWHLPLDAQTFANVDIAALRSAIPVAAPAILISVVALLLNTSSLELLTRQDIRLNQELKATGIANLLSGLAGGLIGYHAMSASALSHALGKGRRLPGLLVALMILLTVVAGAELLSFIPRLLLGALLLYIGLALLYEWVVEARTSFPTPDYVVILIIFGVIASSDFLWGIGVGSVLTIVLFLVNYSRVDVVRHELTGASARSRVSRDIEQAARLERDGEQLLIFQLQGFIFFGTANMLLERVRDRASRPGPSPLRFIVLDFELVSGVDSTAVLSFAKLLQFTRKSGIELLLSHLSPRAGAQLERGGIGSDGPGLLRPDTLDHAIELCEQKLLAAHAGDAAEPDLAQRWRAIVANPLHIGALLERMQRREVAVGDVLMRQGGEPEELFIVESGRFTAQLERPGQTAVRLQTMQGAQIVGELGFFLGTQRNATVRADGPGVVYSLTRAQWLDLTRLQPQVAQTLDRLVIHLLSQRVTHLTRVVQALQ